jgi:hypothetical protein
MNVNIKIRIIIAEQQSHRAIQHHLTHVSACISSAVHPGNESMHSTKRPSLLHAAPSADLFQCPGVIAGHSGRVMGLKALRAPPLRLSLHWYHHYTGMVISTGALVTGTSTAASQLHPL